MAYDKFSLFHYLEKDGGWSVGEEGIFPDGWVRVYEEKVYQGSGFGPESRTWHLLKTNPSWTNDDADLLEKKFPKPEKSKSLSLQALKNIGL